MPRRLFIAVFLTLFAGIATAVAASTEKSDVKRHPLRGVITGIMAERSSLLVKHEEIPGVMRAMTMLFKVDAATLKTAKEGQTITGLMSRQGNVWLLEDVKVILEKKK